MKACTRAPTTASSTARPIISPICACRALTSTFSILKSAVINASEIDFVSEDPRLSGIALSASANFATQPAISGSASGRRSGRRPVARKNSLSSSNLTLNFSAHSAIFSGENISFEKSISLKKSLMNLSVATSRNAFFKFFSKFFVASSADNPCSIPSLKELASVAFIASPQLLTSCATSAASGKRPASFRNAFKFSNPILKRFAISCISASLKISFVSSMPVKKS